MPVDAALVRTFHALADPLRLEILGRLAAAPSGVTELARELPITRQGTAKHLAVLREAGLVTASTAGRESVYRVQAVVASDAARWLEAASASWDMQLGLLKAAAEAPPQGPGGAAED